jgi:hypothetical protein
MIFSHEREPAVSRGIHDRSTLAELRRNVVAALCMIATITLAAFVIQAVCK